jgi:hypothetical protein
MFNTQVCGSIFMKKKTTCPMPNFNENNIGFTKFCQENLKFHENMLQKYLCPMAFCTGPYCLGSLTAEQPVLRALSSQNVHLLTYPVKKNIQDVI